MENLWKIKPELKKALAETDGHAKYIAFYFDKGGTGKSTGSFNFAGLCADVLNKRVLVIDGDRSRNITNTFHVYADYTIADVFKTGKYQFCKTENPNIDVLAGDDTFTDDGVNMDKANTKYMEFVTWIFHHKDLIDQEYDFVVIDTHNDKSRVTWSLLVATDIIVNVVSPDGDCFKALNETDEFIENEIKPGSIPAMSRESVFNADNLILANKIVIRGNNVTSSSKEFIKRIKQFDNYIGTIPHRKELEESRLLGENVFVNYLRQSKSKQEELKMMILNIFKIYQNIIIAACNKVKAGQK
jgi:putative uncharacterized protein gbs0406